MSNSRYRLRDQRRPHILKLIPESLQLIDGDLTSKY